MNYRKVAKPISKCGEGCVMVWDYLKDFLIQKAKGTLSGCIISWIHEITGP